MKLYENIKQLRQEHGWSQDALAKKVGYTCRSSITKIEAGDVDLSQSKILAFAEVFGVDPVELMGLDDEEGKKLFGEDVDKANEQIDLLPRDRTEELIIRIYRTLSPEDKETVTKLIERLAPREQA